MDKLETIYYDISDSGGYAGITALYRSAREKGLKVTIKNVKDFLSRQDAYTLHKPARLKIRRNRTIVYGLNQQFQMDLCDLQKIAKYNNKNRYLLCCIDVFSRMAFVEPVKDKRGATVATALKKILDNGRSHVPKVIQSDKGLEFLSHLVQDELKSRKIKFFTTNSEVKSALIERFIRTLRSRLYRYFTHKNTLKYVDVIQDLVSAYNNSYHRSIKCKPIEVTEENTKQVWLTLYGDLDFSPPSNYAFDIGDIVRISRNKGHFEQGYHPNWSEELFKVSARVARNPPVYKIEDLNSTPILGSFYSEEVQAVGKDVSNCTYKIERVLKKRRRSDKTIELYVRWKGYGPEFDSWVQEVDLQ